ncbi:hypothetical protein RB597_009701 [Gaeumannomyces tritici]
MSMGPKKGSDESVGASKRATDNDLRFFESYLKHMNSVPDVSWDEVAADMGLAHGGSARERFRQIKQKLGWAGPAATPRGNKRKSAAAAAAAAAAEDGDDFENPSLETPSKKPRAKTATGRKKGKGRTPVEDVKGEEALADGDAQGDASAGGEKQGGGIEFVMAGEA